LHVTYQYIRYERNGPAGVITLNRPERLNAFIPAMRFEIQQALKEAEADDAVRAVIFTGAGRGFCSGMDLSAGDLLAVSPPPGPDDPHKDLPGEGRLVMSLFDLTKPVIAAINGVAVGAGAAMLLPMDIRLASTEAKISFAFARLGLVPEMASGWFLPRLVGPSTAMEWLVTGRTLTPQEAQSAGLFKEVLDPDALMPRALELAAEIAAASPVSVAVARRMCLRFEALGSPRDALVIDGPIVRARVAAEDAKEAARARAEKRPAAFTDPISKDFLRDSGLD
jgi:enoyl-CoA hydratase/carnithine racemase